jgi:hypothetical protein
MGGGGGGGGGPPLAPAAGGGGGGGGAPLAPGGGGGGGGGGIFQSERNRCQIFQVWHILHGIFDLLILVCVGSLKVKYGVRYPKFIWAPCAQLYSVRICVVGPIADEHKVSFSRQLQNTGQRRFKMSYLLDILVAKRGP